MTVAFACGAPYSTFSHLAAIGCNRRASGPVQTAVGRMILSSLRPTVQSAVVPASTPESATDFLGLNVVAVILPPGST
jgi:hypothetical protein